jgi:hypothetical protein
MKVPGPPRRSMLPLEKSDASRQDDRAQYRNRIGTSSKNVRSSLQHGALMCIAYPALKCWTTFIESRRDFVTKPDLIYPYLWRALTHG